MKQKIRNVLLIECDEVDFEKVSNIEFFVKQGDLSFVYTPIVLGSHQMAVNIPHDDAMQLNVANVRMQFAFMDEVGNPKASEIVVKPVGELLKEAGYDPV